eukprot:14200393-Alexandrium_andersonii.AAC.1
MRNCWVRSEVFCLEGPALRRKTSKRYGWAAQVKLGIPHMGNGRPDTMCAARSRPQMAAKGTASSPPAPVGPGCVFI